MFAFPALEREREKRNLASREVAPPPFFSLSSRGLERRGKKLSTAALRERGRTSQALAFPPEEVLSFTCCSRSAHQDFRHARSLKRSYSVLQGYARPGSGLSFMNSTAFLSLLAAFCASACSCNNQQNHHRKRPSRRVVAQQTNSARNRQQVRKLFAPYSERRKW